MTFRHWRRARQAVQALSFLAFTLAVILTLRDAPATLSAATMMRLDPLAASTAMIAARRWLPRLAPAFLLLGLSLVVGRAWCGWLCPLGTLSDWFAPTRRRSPSPPALAPEYWGSPRSTGARETAHAAADLPPLPVLGERTGAREPARAVADLLPLPVLGENPSTLGRGPGVRGSAARGAKYGLLFVIAFAALWGNLTLLVLDPLTLFIRGITTLVLPGLTWLVTQAETALYRVAPLRGALLAFDRALRGTVLSYEQPFYGGLLLAALLGGILAFGLVARRAWCRYLCPLGGLYSLTARASWLKRRVSDACVACGACARACSMATIDPAKGYTSDSGECILCLDCADACPKGAISFVGTWGVDRGYAYDPSRRQALGALGISLAGLALLKAAPSSHHPDAHRLRPPGADEAQLLAACVRCGACLRVCPTHGLQPSLTEAGLEGLWTPILVPRLGACDYSCTACGEACPTGAIPPLVLDAKRLTAIGKAYVDPVRCIPWSGRAECIVCEEMCPLPQKAITLEIVRAEDVTGAVRELQAPVVDHERCIGCGMCENMCPVNGEAAIRVIVDPMG